MSEVHNDLLKGKECELEFRSANRSWRNYTIFSHHAHRPYATLSRCYTSKISQVVARTQTSGIVCTPMRISLINLLGKLYYHGYDKKNDNYRNSSYVFVHVYVNKYIYIPFLFYHFHLSRSFISCCSSSTYFT